MKHINQKNYTVFLKADKERIMGELSQIKAAILLNNPITKKMIDDNGEEWVIKTFSRLPIDNENETYEALRLNGVDITEFGVVTIKTINGRFGFGLDHMSGFEKLIKRNFPDSIVITPVCHRTELFNPSHTVNLDFFDKDGCYKIKEQVVSDIDARIAMNQENIVWAKQCEKPKLVQLYQKEIDLLKKSKIEVEYMDFESLEIERYITKELTHNPLLIKAKEDGKYSVSWIVQFGIKLLKFNLFDYSLPSIKTVDDLNNILNEASAIKNKAISGQTLEDWLQLKIEKKETIEAERKRKYWSNKKDWWKVRSTKSQQYDYKRLSDQIANLDIEISTINVNFELIELALKNEPFQVRKTKTN
jgi:hypothetical protein